MIVFAVIQPIMFVLLFSQVYGGAIAVQGTDYVQFLMAGIFAQTVVFGSTFSGSRHGARPERRASSTGSAACR